MRVFTHAYTQVQNPWDYDQVLPLSLSILLPLDRVYHWTGRFILVELVNSRGLCYFIPQCFSYRHSHQAQLYYEGAGYLNSGPHAAIANTHNHWAILFPLHGFFLSIPKCIQSFFSHFYFLCVKFVDLFCFP